MSPMNILSINW